MEGLFEQRVSPGTLVNWYKGHKAEENARQVGVVISSNDQGVVELVVLPKLGGGAVERVRSCYHISHQQALVDHNGIPNANAIRYGCWDFTPASRMVHDMLNESGDDVVDFDELFEGVIEKRLSPILERLDKLEKAKATKKSTTKKSGE